MNKHIARYNGQIFTRNSKGRRYTHCVVALPSREVAFRFANALHDGDASSWEYYASPRAYNFSWTGGDRVVVDASTFYSAEEFLAVFPTAAVYQAYQRDRRVTKFAQRVADGEFTTYVPMGWCGRRDLADKLRSKTAASGYWLEVVVLEAEIV